MWQDHLHQERRVRQPLVRGAPRSAVRERATPTTPEGNGPRWRDGGAAAVEMALVLPLLLLFIFGIIDFGRMLNTQISLTTAAQEGARVAAFGGDPGARVRAITGEDVDVKPGETCPSSTGDAEVTVTHKFTFVTPVGLLGSGLANEIVLSGRGVMPCQ
ncbi:MAG TPA: TadE family protein [Micromonosporaceae bacterium]